MGAGEWNGAGEREKGKLKVGGGNILAFCLYFALKLIGYYTHYDVSALFLLRFTGKYDII